MSSQAGTPATTTPDLSALVTMLRTRTRPPGPMVSPKHMRDEDNLGSRGMFPTRDQVHGQELGIGVTLELPSFA